MKRIVAFAFAAVAATAAWTADPPASITNARIETRTGVSPTEAFKEAGRGKAEWVGWSVTAVSDADDVCCFTSHFKRRECNLSDRDNSWGTTDRKAPGGPVELFVLVEVKDGVPVRLRLMDSACPVNGSDRRVVWLGPIDPDASLDALSRLLDSAGRERNVRDEAVAAIAYHASPRADTLLEKRAFDRSLSKEEREGPIFWAGNVRGEAGYKLLERVLTFEPMGDLREHAVFALTESSVPGAVDRIKRVAVEDRDNDVRAQALFWLAQTNTEGAGAWIVGRLDAEKDDHVREQAVFALSQLKDGTDWLLRLLRSKRDPETVRHALFWLGQSDDPRAFEEIQKILEK
jgi:hypothetical protein